MLAQRLRHRHHGRDADAARHQQAVRRVHRQRKVVLRRAHLQRVALGQRPHGARTATAIVEAIEGPLNMTECSGEHSSCEHEAHCGVQTHWRRINDVIGDALSGITLAEMLPGARPARGIPSRLATA